MSLGSGPFHVLLDRLDGLLRDQETGLPNLVLASHREHVRHRTKRCADQKRREPRRKEDDRTSTAHAVRAPAAISATTPAPPIIPSRGRDPSLLRHLGLGQLELLPDEQ